MKNYDVKLEGVVNRVKGSGGHIQWFSTSFETGWENGALQFVSAHLWLFGIQLFEFSLQRKKAS